MGDGEQYRPAGEVERLKGLDPIPRYRRRLLEDGVPEAELSAGERAAREAVEAAFAFARSSPPPALAEAMEFVFTGVGR
jgi:acetoin:2,6-dichlorophenolindophenol oxidoreductase subunit alpha